VLLAEDNPADVFLIQEALALRFKDLEIEISVQQDGEQMMQTIDMLDRGGTPCPDVILLDLNLPRITGDEALERLRKSSLFGRVPVVVVTSSNSPRDHRTADLLGANRYFRKPTDYDEFMKLGDLVEDVIGFH
jgi:CheY-like chemotaxis protein